MASTLSPSAIHRIIFFAENDDRPAGDEKEGCGNYGLSPSSLPRRYPHVLPKVNRKWKAVYKLYMDIEPGPPLGYFDSLELGLVFKGEVDDADVRAIFGHGKSLDFWGCPPLLVSKIVEAFRGMQKEPTYLDVTITALSGLGATMPSEAWPQVYKTYLPCRACSAVETVEGRSILRRKYADCKDPVGNVDVVVEKFHISSGSIGKQMTVELHYQLEKRTSGEDREHYTDIHKITVRLDSGTCSAHKRLSGIANRISATPLLLPDFASDVFGCFERAHVGSSLLANRGIRDLICQLKHRLPVHHLKCAFEQELDFDCDDWLSGAYWLSVHHIQRDLSYADVRRFKIPSTAGAEDDCALIRHYLSNSHVVDLGAPRADFPFAIKMLADLASRNFSVGGVELYTAAKRLSDYRSMDAVFGGLRMSELYLSCDEHRFVELVKTTDFFRTSTVQRLRELKLTLSKPCDEEQKPRGHAGSRSPLWLAGIRQLRDCYYRVNYETDRHLRLIERKVVQICGDFERGKITDIVDHFQFQLKSYAPQVMNYAFSRDKLHVSGMTVEGKYWDCRINEIEWDVYRFRNAITSDYLTACVGKDKEDDLAECFLHIVKGEVYPEASFADYW